MKKAIEIVRVDPSHMIIECNRVLDIIEKRRDSLFEKEILEIKEVFGLDYDDALNLAKKMIPYKSVINFYKEEYYNLAEKYLFKCIEISILNDSQFSIARNDYKLIQNFE